LKFVHTTLPFSVQPQARDNGRLMPVDPAAKREVLELWKLADDGMNGPRGGVPEKPDDPVANLLLEAAGQAIQRGQVQRGVTILKLVVKDYRQSQEAALARAALDQLAKSRGR
jgi:hypothetical protein